MSIRVFITVVSFFCALAISGQTTSTITAEREQRFGVYMYWRHGGPDGLAEFKKASPDEYAKELWYYTSSFTVKRNHLSTGVELDEYNIDISRLEKHRLQDQPYVLELTGYKDALILMPARDLLWRPKQ